MRFTIDAGNRAVKKSKFKNILLERIACPVDPSHTIYKHNLLLHTKICNVKTRLTEMKEEQFYCQDCNSGLTNAQNNADITDNSTAYDIPEPHDIPGCDPDLLYSKIKECYRRLELAKELSFLGNTFEEHSRGLGKRGGVGADEFRGPVELKIDDKRINDVDGGQDVKDNAIDIKNDHVDSNNDIDGTERNTATINNGYTSHDNSGSSLDSASRQIVPSVPPTEQSSLSASDSTYAPSTAYGLLEARVVGAVSGEQVAFLRVRHAAQDAKIVWYVRVSECANV